MEFESAQSNTNAKLPILKLGEYEMWVIRIKQYFHVQVYALWEVIKNGNSWVFIPQTTQENGTSVIKMLQKIVSRLAILGMVITQEDLNSKFQRSLPPEWNTHVVVWMNKVDIETMSIDDLYNNFKIVEQDVKKSVGASSGAQNLAFFTTLRTSSTNDVNTANPAYEVSTVSPNINTACPQVSTANFSDNTVYAFMVENPNGSNLLQQNLEQIHEDDLEVMDLKWQLSLLSMRAKRYFQRTGKKIFTNANDTVGYDKSKVECFNCHKMGHFARKCRAPRKKEGQFKYQDNTRKNDEVIFSEEVAVLKREVACKDYEINVLKNPKFKSYGSEDSKQESNIVCDKKSNASKENSDDSLIKEQVSEDTSSFVESPLNVDNKLLIANTIKGKGWVNQENALKASACWVWRPTKPDSASITLKKHNCIDALGRSKNMTGNIAYLSDFKEFDRGYVTFGIGAHGGRISSKGTLKTDSLDFEDLPDETHILLKIPRKDNMYSFDMKNIVPKESLTCLVAKATLDESMLWHRRLGHINFKNINKLVKDNLVRGLPTKRFENDQTCVACLKGKQHRASCKSKVLNPITKPLFMLHMDLFGLTFVSSLMHKKYCLVVTDDYSRFTWVFFLTTKDETSEILKNFIKEIENLVDKKVKIIRSDKEPYLRIKQNGMAERRNKTLIEAARTMLADSKLPTTFYVKQFVSVASIGIGKFYGKSDEGFFVGYSLSSKAFRVYNTRTRRVEENLYIGFLENKPMIEGNGPKWLFDIDSLTQSMNYVPVAAGTISNESAGTQEEFNAGTSTQKEEISQDYIMMPIWKDASHFDSPSKDVGNVEPKYATDDQKQVEDGLHNESGEKDKSDDDSSPKEVNTAGQHVNTTSPEVNTSCFKLNNVDPSVNTASSYDPDSPKDMFKMGASRTLKATHVEFFSDEDEPEVDLGNITNSYTVPPTPNTRIHKDHPITNVIGDVKSTIQTRRMTKSISKQGFLSAVYEQKTHDTLNTCLYACFLSQIEPTSIAKALSDSSWVEPMLFYGFSGISNGCEELAFLNLEPLGRGLQVQQKEDGIFISQDKYVDKILKKFNYTNVKSASTLVDLEKPLVKDGDADDVDVHLYRSMIGSLMYLTASRPDIMFAASQKEVGTLRYLSLVVPLKKIGDEAVHKELGDRMERAATTASSLEAEQESGNINKIQSMSTLNGSSP
ncbi:putative ribonuclease H-like domain-containing protein [Tanacetum coccineum]|uniref:Ribonuclease H-like domain-containing protein n=1 Tax=Tanacetum coccineum TaxID=301880 RepID=A0ABQ5A5F7_9ASTR